MKTKELWDNYEFFTKELTKFSRHLAFAGVGISWLFHTKSFTFPDPIFQALISYCIFFLLDISQYYLSALILNRWIRQKEKESQDKNGKIDDSYEKPDWLDRPAFILFNLKILFLVVGFIFIILEFIKRIWH